MNWVTSETGHRCLRHRADFARGQVCSKCVADDDEGDIVDTLTDQTSGQLDDGIVGRAATYRDRAEWFIGEAKKLLGSDSTWSEKNAAVKMSGEAVKWERLALEAYDKISARKHLREAMAHERAMSGKRGHH